MTDPAFSTISLEGDGARSTALSVGTGPVVLCLHGFPDHAPSFRHQLPALAAAGFRAVAPTLRGYEPSSQPGRSVAHYHPVRVAHDVVHWARMLDESPVHLVGHDWGAVASYLAAALAPERFRSMVTLAVPPLAAVRRGIRRHPGQLRKSWYMFFFQLRGIADRVVARNDFAFLERLWQDWSPGWQWDETDMQHLKKTFRQPGVLSAALAYYRATFHPFLEDSRRMQSLAGTPCRVPLLAITGADDGCLDTRIYDCIDPRHFPAGVRVERIEDAGHFVHQEAPQRINALLLEWLTAS